MSLFDPSEVIAHLRFQLEEEKAARFRYEFMVNRLSNELAMAHRECEGYKMQLQEGNASDGHSVNTSKSSSFKSRIFGGSSSGGGGGGGHNSSNAGGGGGGGGTLSSSPPRSDAMDVIATTARLQESIKHNQELQWEIKLLKEKVNDSERLRDRVAVAEGSLQQALTGALKLQQMIGHLQQDKVRLEQKLDQIHRQLHSDDNDNDNDNDNDFVLMLMKRMRALEKLCQQQSDIIQLFREGTGGGTGGSVSDDDDDDDDEHNNVEDKSRRKSSHNEAHNSPEIREWLRSHGHQHQHAVLQTVKES